MGPRAGLEGRKISPPAEIRSPDRPAGSKSLYRLSCLAHHTFISFVLKSKYKKDLNTKKLIIKRIELKKNQIKHKPH